MILRMITVARNMRLPRGDGNIGEVTEHMETLLIILVVLLLLGGGGWGYSRWRR